MFPHDTASKRFEKFDNKRQGILRRLERYAAWTVPKLFPIKNRDQDTEPLTHGFQSLGAQSTNHLANRLMMSLFQPNRPFFRLEADEATKRKLQEAGADPKTLQSALAKAEQDASMELDKRSIRSRLYDMLKMLIVLGNALMIFEKDSVRILNLRHYVVKRNKEGKVVEMVVREKVNKEHLSAAAYAQCLGRAEFKPDADGCCYEYQWIKLRDGKYDIDTWIDDVKLNASFSSRVKEEKLKYRAVTWDLASGDDYGTGLVEDYEADFQSLSMLSEATVYAAILASEYRWIVNPTGQTQIEDFQNSPNGGALPGQKDDISLLSHGLESNVGTNIQLQQMYINRIGAGFMLQSAVTRDAERVTKEEIQRNAEELEGGLGGAYSRIAVDVQVPTAYWTMDLIGKDIVGKGIEPVIITGLAALSRSGDRDRLLAFGTNLASVLSLPPVILGRLRLSAWMSDLAAAEGIDPNTYVLTEEEYQQQQTVLAQQQLAMQNASQQINNANTPQEA